MTSKSRNENVIIDGMPFDEYLKLPAFSKSMAVHLQESPKRLKYKMDSGDDVSTARMDFGTLVDAILFEPATFHKRFWVVPETYINSEKKVAPWTRQSKTCKAIESEARSKGLIPITGDDFERAQNIVNEIKSHPEASSYLKSGKPQQTIIWNDEETGVKCKGRIDLLLPDRIVDLKVTYSVNPNDFRRVMYRLLYHVQGAMYHDGLVMVKKGFRPNEVMIPFTFITVEDQPPHDVVCCTLGMGSTQAGQEVYRGLLRTYKDCLLTNRWPGRSDECEEIDIPDYALNQILMSGAEQ